MFYGIEFPPAGECGDPNTLAEFARLAEEVEWDGVFLEDCAFHHNDTYRSVSGAPTYDPWMALAAMAARTEHVRLGTAITPLPRRRPWKLAREAVSLDYLSGGRLTLGVDSGDVSDKGFTHFGKQSGPRHRAGLLDEGLLARDHQTPIELRDHWVVTGGAQGDHLVGHPRPGSPSQQH